MNMNFTLGQNVGIARTGSWDTVLEGLYTVTKVNKVRVELTITHSTGTVSTRTFSIRTGLEKGEFVSTRTYLMSEVDYNGSVESKRVRRERECAFDAVRNLAAKVGRCSIAPVDLAALKAAVAALDQYATV